MQQLDGEALSRMYRNGIKRHLEVDGSSGRCRLEVAWPVCEGGGGGGGNFQRLYRTLTYIVIVVYARIIDTLIVGL